MTDKEIINAFKEARLKEQGKLVIRPKFTLKKELTLIIMGLAVMAGTLFFHGYVSTTIFIMAISIEIFIFIFSQTKNILLILIFLYQRFAPQAVRSACLFKPCCSEYMRQSIIKYGVLKGIKRGFDRIRRCHPPNGGVDEP